MQVSDNDHHRQLFQDVIRIFKLIVYVLYSCYCLYCVPGHITKHCGNVRVCMLKEHTLYGHKICSQLKKELIAIHGIVQNV